MALEPQDPGGVEPGHGVQAGDIRACRAAAGVDDDHLAGELAGAAAIEFHTDGMWADERAFPADQLQPLRGLVSGKVRERKRKKLFSLDQWDSHAGC